MLQFIAFHRLLFVAVISALLAGLFWRRDWRNGIMAASGGVVISSAIVIVAIAFNATQLWWLPANRQTPLTFDVPSLLKPLVAPIEAIAADQLHVEAAIVASKSAAQYALALVAAAIVFFILAMWKNLSFRREVRYVSQALKNNPQLLR